VTYARHELIIRQKSEKKEAIVKIPHEYIKELVATTLTSDTVLTDVELMSHRVLGYLIVYFLQAVKRFMLGDMSIILTKTDSWTVLETAINEFVSAILAYSYRNASKDLKPHLIALVKEFIGKV
jgi:hypothetical protein